MTENIQLNLYDTEFVKLVAAHVREFFNDAVNPDPILRRDNYYIRSPRPSEIYSSDVLKSTGELISACDQMELSKQLLSGFRSNKFGNLVITRYEFIVYHVENYLFRAGMITDRCLKLVNTVFDLGKKPEQCKFDVIAKNVHVATTSVPSILKSIRKELKDVQMERNNIAHFKSYDHQDIYHVGLHSMMTKSGEDEYTKRAFHIIKAKADKFIALKKAEMSSLNQKVLQHVATLLDNLIFTYTSKLSVFHEIST